jgi:transposase
MKITNIAEEINLNQIMDISVDVHKDNLNFFFAADNRGYTDIGSNRTDVIERRIIKYQRIAKEHGMNNLRIICEPTGQYQNSLLRTARRHGCLTCYVNAESVKKFRVVETNDTGKTDIKDPRVISTLARLNKVLKHRMLGEDYLMLRKLGKIYDETDVEIVRLKGRLNKLMVELFCDYSFKKDFLCSDSGFALVEKYGYNPYRIVKSGFKRFCKTMKRAAPRIREMTLKRLFEDAQSSVLNELPPGYIEVLQQRFYQLFQDYLKQGKRKEEIVKKMIEILNRLREKDPNIPPPTSGVISAKNLARLLGETGPISDFSNWRKLMRYFGLNIRMRQSGKYQGQYKITKKGRPLGRKVLDNIILTLVKQGCIYGQYYHVKKEKEKRPGNKAMTIVMRNFLKKFYGWYQSGKAFDQKRFFNSESRYSKAA